MVKHTLFFIFLFLLALGFWYSADFKTIAAGIAIFLFGMMSLQQGFRYFTGGVLERVLHAITDSLPKRLCFGILSTMMMQSSSLLSVLVISFISAGLLDLAAGIGIIFGANLGTTTGAWLVAGFGIKVKIAAYAMPLLVFGVLCIFNKSKNLQGIGYILSGIGFLFLGIHYMKEGFEIFKTTLDLSQYALTGWRGLLIYVCLGIAATIIIQSSDATMVLIITALSAQQLSYENALALAIGANIGTTVTAILGSLTANIKGKRLAGAHFLFNVFTGLVAIVFINQFIWLVEQFSAWVGIAEDDFTLKLAAFHSMFNLVGISVMLPLTKSLARLLNKLFQEKKAKADTANFLTQSALQYPETAVQAVLQETRHLYDNAVYVILKSLGLHRRHVFSQQDLKAVVAEYEEFEAYDIDSAYERHIKAIYSAIIEFIIKARFSRELKQSGRLHWLREANLKLAEAVKGVKHLQKNLLKNKRPYHMDAYREYQRIRYQIALLIRELEEVKNSPGSNELPLLTLDMLKGRLKEQRQSGNENIEDLIRKQRISAETGTSLMNDRAYVNDIQANLIAMAETVFINYADTQTKIEKELALNENELLEAINPKADLDHE